MALVSELPEQLLYQYWQQVKSGNSKFVAFDHTEMVEHEWRVDRLIASLNPSVRINIKFEPGKHLRPYAPLRSLYHEFADGKALDDELYQPLHEQLVAFLTTECQLQVRDESFYEEVGHLKPEMLNAMTGYLTHWLDGQDTVIWLENIEYASPSTWEWFAHISEKAPDGRFCIIATYDSNVRFEEDSTIIAWRDFVRMLEDRRISLASSEREERREPVIWLSLKKDEYSENRRLLSEQIALLAFSDIKLLFADNQTKSVDKIDSERGFRDYEQYADGLYFLNDLSHAAILYERLAATTYVHQHDLILARLHRKLALCFYKRMEMKTARRYAANSLSIAQEAISATDEMFALYTLLQIEGQSLNHVNYESLLSLIHLAPPLMQAYCHRKSYTFHRYYESIIKDYQKTLRLYEGNCNTAIDWYITLKDEHNLATAYQEFSVVLTLQERFRDALDCLYKCERVRRKFGNPVELIGVNNGLGYMHMLLGDYVEAHAKFRLALAHIWHIRDYQEIGATLFNLGFNAMVARSHRQAMIAFDSTLELMNVLGIRNIPYHELMEVRLLTAISAYLCGEKVYAMKLFAQVTENDCQINSQVRSMFHLAVALFSIEHIAPFEDIEDAFELSVAALDSNIYADKCLKLFVLFEYALFLKRHRQVEIETFIAEALVACNQVNNETYTAWFCRLADDPEAAQSCAVLEEASVNLLPFLGLASKETEIRRLQEKLHEIQFLQSLQTIFVVSESDHDVCSYFIKQIRSHYPIEIVVILQHSHNHWSIVDSSMPKSFPVDWIDNLMDNSDSFEEQTVLSYERLRMMPYLPMALQSLATIRIQPSDDSEYALLLGTLDEGLTLTHDDLDMIILASNQLSTVIAKLEKEAELKRLSTTDVLTGLSNRTSWEMRLSEEIQRVKRYKGQPEHELSIAFVDLDNFKHYNDTYGHDVGDIVLQRFANIVQTSIRDLDFAARFGGDEFVILFPETRSECAITVCERILSHFEHLVNKLDDYISDQLGKEIVHDPKRRLGISIGVAGYDMQEAEQRTVRNILKCADNAVYKAKANGKNCIHCWSAQDAFSL